MYLGDESDVVVVEGGSSEDGADFGVESECIFKEVGILYVGKIEFIFFYKEPFFFLNDEGIE